MRKTLSILALGLASLVIATPDVAGATSTTKSTALTRFENEIRRDLVTLPWLGIFDNLQFKIDGSKVTLLGQVTRPTLKSDAERVVRRIEGVETVENRIEVLPLSRFDDDIRIMAYRMIYGYGPLQRYALVPQGPIRIIVKNGEITLTGVVANDMDRNLVYMRARQVPGAFTVNNNLQVESRG